MSPAGKGFRFQPVVRYEGDEKIFSLCTVFLNDDMTLSGWSETADIIPYGNNQEDLTGELCRMLMDSSAWEPVDYDELVAGMKFKARITMGQRSKLADMIEMMP